MIPRIVLSNSSFLVVDKPTGWLVHPTRPDGTFTLIDWLREQFPGEFLSLVSRLDRETSGLLLVARGKENASLLGKMQQRREIHKTYLAIVHGTPPAAGVIDQPLDRLGKHQPSRIYIRQAVVPGTYPAVTEFKTLASRTHPEHGKISLVEASPKTGRLHQIRAHFDFLGFPVLNDKIYGKKDDFFINYIDKDLKIRPIIGRHCLHSSKLSFTLCLGSEVKILGVRAQKCWGQRLGESLFQSKSHWLRIWRSCGKRRLKAGRPLLIEVAATFIESGLPPSKPATYRFSFS